MQLVGETLNAKGKPHAFAESTLIRTAITAASYSLWMLSEHPTERERRFRALQFIFKDCAAYAGYVRTQSQDPAATEAEREEADEVIGEMRRRQEWIVEQANALTGASQTFKEFRQDLPSDTEIVEQAGTRVLSAWRFLGGYAHGLPWATLGNQVAQGDPDPETGVVTVSQRGNSEQLLNAAFYTLEGIEKAIWRFRVLCGAVQEP